MNSHTSNTSSSAGSSTATPKPGISFHDNGFREPPSAPAELLPTLTGATVHTYRYSSFIREHDLRDLRIGYSEACGLPYSVKTNGKAHPLIGIFANLGCAGLHLGYLAGHTQRWTSQGTALGEVVYSLSLAPGESRNIAIIDLRRRQQDRRDEQTETSEQLVSNQDHTFALQEVATAVALEHQYGKTTVEANTLVAGGAFVAAGALVGGVGGGVIGSLIEPGIGTAVGAGLGAGAGVVAGGLVFAGAQALGMIESDSTGNRDIMARSNQRIAQSTSQQSALIRSLWSTVVTEDIQEESLQARTTNITNYNHMHALNMEYYEILHRYDVTTSLDSVTPLLYLPFGALPLKEEWLVDEFWDSIRQGLPDDLQEKGDRVFVDPPPPEFVPEPVPDAPDPVSDVRILGLELAVEIQWDLDWGDAIAAALGAFVGGLPLAALMIHADEVFKEVRMELQLEGTHYTSSLPVVRHDDFASGTSTFSALFPGAIEAAKITGVRLEINSPTDIFDENGIRVRLRVETGTVRPPAVIDNLAGLEITNETLPYETPGRGMKVFPWNPMEEVENAYEAALAEIEAVETRNEEGEAAHQALLDQLQTWKMQVLEAIGREPYRFTLIILSNMESGRLGWILDRLYIAGDDDNESGSIPLHALVHTTPIGISSDSVVLKMKHFDIEKVRKTALQLFQLDDESTFDLHRLLQWQQVLDARFKGDNSDLTTCETIFLPGAGVFGEAVLGRSNASEYIDPDRFWNWQDSPIPNQAAGIRPLSTEPRNSAPLPTEPKVPDAELPLVSPPDFPAPVGLSGVLQAVRNGNIFRDMSKADQLAGILGNLSDLAAGTVDAASKLTGDAAAATLGSATEIGRQVASMTDALMSKAPAQAARPPGNPTTATAASTAVDRAEDKSPQVLDATRNAWGIPGPVPAPDTSPGNGQATGAAPARKWRPVLDQGKHGPGSVAKIVPQDPPLKKEATQELQQVLDDAAEDTGAMPDTSLLLPPLERWYRDSVIPLLVFARFNDEYLTSAIAQYFDWLGNMQLLGLEAEAQQMENLHGEAMPLIRFGLENAIRTAFAEMEANNDLEYATDVFDWIALAMQLGIEDQSELFSFAGSAKESPLHVLLEGPLEPQEDLGTGEHYELTLSGGLAIGANPPLPGVVVDVTIEVENGSSVPASGSIHPSLEMASTIQREDNDPVTIEVTGRTGLFLDAWEFETVRSVVLD